MRLSTSGGGRRHCVAAEAAMAELWLGRPFLERVDCIGDEYIASLNRLCQLTLSYRSV
jgi:hypothetical protein